MLGFDFKALQALFSSAPTVRVFDNARLPTTEKPAGQIPEKNRASDPDRTGQPQTDVPLSGLGQRIISLDGRNEMYGETSRHSWRRLADVMGSLPNNVGYKAVTMIADADGLTVVWRRTNSEK